MPSGLGTAAAVAQVVEHSQEESDGAALGSQSRRSDSPAKETGSTLPSQLPRRFQTSPSSAAGAARRQPLGSSATVLQSQLQEQAAPSLPAASAAIEASSSSFRAGAVGPSRRSRAIKESTSLASSLFLSDSRSSRSASARRRPPSREGEALLSSWTPPATRAATASSRTAGDHAQPHRRLSSAGAGKAALAASPVASRASAAFSSSAALARSAASGAEAQSVAVEVGTAAEGSNAAKTSTEAVAATQSLQSRGGALASLHAFSGGRTSRTPTSVWFRSGSIGGVSGEAGSGEFAVSEKDDGRLRSGESGRSAASSSSRSPKCTYSWRRCLRRAWRQLKGSMNARLADEVLTTFPEGETARAPPRHASPMARLRLSSFRDSAKSLVLLLRNSQTK